METIRAEPHRGRANCLLGPQGAVGRSPLSRQRDEKKRRWQPSGPRLSGLSCVGGCSGDSGSFLLGSAGRQFLATFISLQKERACKWQQRRTIVELADVLANDCFVPLI